MPALPRPGVRVGILTDLVPTPVAATPTRASASAPTATPAVVLRGVSAGYGGRLALSDVDLVVPRGSLLAVVGPNGAGKSTLLKVMAGLLPPLAGQVEVLGQPVGRAARRVAYLPQAEVVDWRFPVAVADVVLMGRYPLIGVGRRVRPEDRDHVDAALATVGMSELRGRQIGELSGGQRRRVFLARALAADPDLFLLDEPVTGVDATTQEDLMDVLEAQARAGRTVVASTHDLLCAAQRFVDAAFINGRVVATGPAHLVLDQRLLAETYGGHVLVLQGEGGSTTLALDDAHHHDQPPGDERHFHESGT